MPELVKRDPYTFPEEYQGHQKSVPFEGRFDVSCPGCKAWLAEVALEDRPTVLICPFCGQWYDDAD